MKLIETLKSIWDPRTPKQKKYVPEPLMKYSVKSEVYIKGLAEPLLVTLEKEDREMDGWFYRANIDYSYQEWVDARAVKGFTYDNTWYPPEQIEKIVKLGTESALKYSFDN